MINKEEIFKLVQIQDWETFLRYVRPETVIHCCNFGESMTLAGKLFDKEYETSHLEQNRDIALTYSDDSLKAFAVDLFFLIRDQYPKEWNEDWKNDGFLGACCSYLYRDREAYNCYMRAYQSLPDPPHTLLFCLANSAESPDMIMSKEDQHNYYREAFNKQATAETAQGMKKVCYDLKDQKGVEYYEHIYQELSRKGQRSLIIIPNV